MLCLKTVGLSWIKATEKNSSILQRLFAKKWPKYPKKLKQIKHTIQQQLPLLQNTQQKPQETRVLYPQDFEQIFDVRLSLLTYVKYEELYQRNDHEI